MMMQTMTTIPHKMKSCWASSDDDEEDKKRQREIQLPPTKLESAKLTLGVRGGFWPEGLGQLGVRSWRVLVPVFRV
jgi:hypothetical protein